MMPSIIIVGGGVGGLTAALECRRLHPDQSVTLIDREREIGYYRTLLPMFMVRTLAEEKLFFWKPVGDAGLDVRLGVGVRSVDAAARRVVLQDGEALAYERLIIAPGGRPVVPPVFGKRSWPKGAFPVRSLEMARKVRDWIVGRKHIVVLGGGLVGSKTAVFMRQAGYDVSLVERQPHILPTVLSAQAAAPMQAHLVAMGIAVHVGATVDDYRTDADDALSEVHISTGRWIPCQAFLIGIGSQPETSLLADSGLLENGELVVSDTLRTSDPNIFAVGDAVAVRRDGLHHPWTWPQAVVQGRYAGANVYRQAPVPIPRVTRVNAQNIAGTPIVVLGGAGAGTSVVSRRGESSGVWRELFLEGGRIAGGALVGDISGAGPLHALMVQGRDVSAEALDHLKTRTRAFAPAAWSRLAGDRLVKGGRTR
jgi:NADPH-dependent 2,4-dienoyl-CoA reductase/sulfur reductase-like enzyme